MTDDRPRTPLSPALTEEFYSALGHTIKVARTELSIDRKDLADAAGISYSYLAAIENGQKQPSSQVLLALANALGLRTHELLESADDWREVRQSPTEDTPSWLADSPDRAFPMKSTPHRRQRVGSPRLTDREAILVELDYLTGKMSKEDTVTLLELARRLAR